MAQVTIYLPDDIEKSARKRAKKARSSLSSFVASLLRKNTGQNDWPRSFHDLYGSCDLDEIESLPPDERDQL